MKKTEIKKEIDTSSEMTTDLETIIAIFEKYVSDKQSKKDLEEIKGIVEKFNNLSDEGKKSIFQTLAWRANGLVADVNEKSCQEFGHKFTKWKELSYCDFRSTRSDFVEKYGSEYVWVRCCKDCGAQEITADRPKTLKKKIK